MKVNINKMESGGAFTVFTPLAPPSVPKPVRPDVVDDSKKEDSNSLLSKDIYKELIGKGLVNDVNYFVEELSKIESKELPFLNGENRAFSLKLIGKVNEIIINKNNWDEALKIAKENNSLGEVAVGSFGEVYVQDKDGNIKSIHLSKIKDNKNKILTLSELLNARQYNPKLAYDKNIVYDVARNSIGLENITTHIKGLISQISQYSNTTEEHFTREQLTSLKNNFGTTPPESAVEGLKLISKILDNPGNQWKIEQVLKTKENSIESALNYIWTTLGKKGQNKLQATALMNGVDSGKRIIYDMLVNALQPEKVLKITPEDTKEEKETKESLAGQKNLSMFQEFHNDKLYTPGLQFAFNDPSFSKLFKGTVGSVGALVTEKDQSIGLSTIGEILRTYGYDRFTDPNKVFYGNKKVDLYNQNNIIYDPQQGAAKVYMPVNRIDGSPDYESLKEFNDLYTVYEANKNVWSLAKAKNHFATKGFNISIDEVNGEKIIKANNEVRPFLVMFGYTNDATGLTKDNKHAIELSKEEKNNILPILEGVWTIGVGKNKQSIVPNKRGKEYYYKSIIAIPYTYNSSEIVNAISGQGAKDKPYSIGQVQRNLLNSNGIPMNGSSSALQLNSPWNGN